MRKLTCTIKGLPLFVAIFFCNKREQSKIISGIDAIASLFLTQGTRLKNLTP